METKLILNLKWKILMILMMKLAVLDFKHLPLVNWKISFTQP